MRTGKMSLALASSCVHLGQMRVEWRIQKLKCNLYLGFSLCKIKHVVYKCPGAQPFQCHFCVMNHRGIRQLLQDRLIEHMSASSMIYKIRLISKDPTLCCCLNDIRPAVHLGQFWSSQFTVTSMALHRQDLFCMYTDIMEVLLISESKKNAVHAPYAYCESITTL